MTPDTTPNGDEYGSRRRWRWTRRVLFGSGIAVALASAGAYFAHAQSRHHGWGGHHAAAFDPQNAAEWAQLMTRQMLRRIDATPEQQERIQAIVGIALKDMLPMREQGRMARQEGIQLLAAPTIDREALERLRAGQIALHEQASKHMTKAVLDIAETLTPAQRDKLALAIAEHRWGWRR